jgi:hypothetical protein
MMISVYGPGGDGDVPDCTQGVEEVAIELGVFSCFLSPAAIPASSPLQSHPWMPYVPTRSHQRTHQTRSSTGPDLAAVLPLLQVPVDRVDGEESGREQLLAVSGLRRDVVPRTAEAQTGAAVVAMTG